MFSPLPCPGPSCPVHHSGYTTVSQHIAGLRTRAREGAGAGIGLWALEARAIPGGRTRTVTFARVVTILRGLARGDPRASGWTRVEDWIAAGQGGP